jgi:hypothetical protein
MLATQIVERQSFERVERMDILSRTWLRDLYSPSFDQRLPPVFSRNTSASVVLVATAKPEFHREESYGSNHS